MAEGGRIGTSLGGRIVRRKDLVPKREYQPVDPDTLSAEALAQREAYRREEAARQEAGIRRAGGEREVAAKRDAASGKRVI
ncbi:MAG: hypothetical protein ACRCYU_16045, partial [Nocardioides sp.]